MRPSHHEPLEGCALPGEEVLAYRTSPALDPIEGPRESSHIAGRRTPLGDLPLDLAVLARDLLLGPYGLCDVEN